MHNSQVSCQEPASLFSCEAAVLITCLSTLTNIDKQPYMHSPTTVIWEFAILATFLGSFLFGDLNTMGYIFGVPNFHKTPYGQFSKSWSLIEVP